MEVTGRPREVRQVRDWHARRACATARELERAGDYEGARAALDKLWTRIGERPVLEQLPADTQAEVLLRAGALSGWLGSARQIPGAQEFARDLITESITIFQALEQPDKWAEALTDLALCYWRSGALDEGRVVFQQAVAKAQSAPTKLRALTNATTVEISSGQYREALALLDEAFPLLGEVKDEASHGRYYSQRALVYKNLGGGENLDHALVHYSAARMHLANAGHIRYLARVENNTGFTLLQLGRAAEALEHLNQARAIFIGLKDAGSVAQVNETRARVFISQQQFADAERAAFAAIATLEQGDEFALLAEALTTQAIALARSGCSDQARKAFQRAAEVAATAGDYHAAAIARLTMIAELRNGLTGSELLALYRSADQQLGPQATASDLEQLRQCGRIIIDAIAGLPQVAEDELVGGSLEQEMLHFEARLIRRALDQAEGSVTRAARQLGLTHQGLCYILDQRHHKTLGHIRKPKRIRRKPLIKKQ